MHKIYPFLLFVFVLSKTFAQQYERYTYTSVDGLPSTYIFGTLLRSNGELIVGTSHGFSKFNGQTFTNYDYSSGLPNLMVHALYEDSKKRLWIGTDQGFCLFDERKMQTQPIAGGIKPGYVFGFIEYKNQVWAYCTNGVFVYNEKTWERIVFDPEQCCKKVAYYKKGLLLILYNKILYYENGKTIPVLKSQDGNPYEVLTVIKDEAYFLYNNAIFKLTPAGTTELVFKPTENFRIFNLCRHEDRLLLFTEKKGIYSYDLQTHKLEFLFDAFIPQQIKYTNGLIWISGFEGLTKIIERKNVKVFNDDLARDVHLSIANPYKKLTYFFGINPDIPFKYYDGLSVEKLPRKISYYSESEFLYDKGCLKDSNNVMVVSRSGHLQIVSLKKRTVSFPLQWMNVYDVACDITAKKTYVSAPDKIYILDSTEKIADSIPVPFAYSLKKLKNGNLIFYSRGQLFLLRGKNIIRCLQLNVPVYRRWDIKIDESDRGIISVRIKGAGVKLFRWDNNKLVEFLTISSALGLRNNSIMQTAFDHFNRIWLLTEYGLSVIDLGKTIEKSPVLKNFGNFGFDVHNWELSSLSIAHDSSLVLATPMGTAIMNAREMTVTEPRLSTFIQSLQVQSHVNSDFADKIFYARDTIILHTNENSFRIKFQAVSFTGSSDISYSYRLLNSDNENWSSSTGSSMVTFIALPPGKYTFEVRSRKPNTEWSIPAALRFEIYPPFWATIWFRIVMGLNLLLLIWFVFQIRLRKIRKESFIQAKLADLEMKALRAQMNPHFIYNALNSIQSLIAAGNQKDAMRYVSKFGKLLRLILERSEEGKTSLQKEIDVNSLYIELEQLRLGFDFGVEINISDEIIPEDEKVPALIIQPIIENALWHGLTNIKDDKKLVIDINATDNYLIIGITDNGPGLAQTSQKSPTSSEKRKSFGSQIVRKRLLTYNNDDKEPVHVRDLKEIGKRGTEVKIFIRRLA